MTNSPAKLEGKKRKAVQTISASTNKTSETTCEVKAPRQMTLSSNADLYFHSQSAEEISDQLQHNRLYRSEFAKKFFQAIHKGQITAYSHRDGSEIEIPIPLATPLCVKVDDVNLWLKNNSYGVQWNPDQIEKKLSDIKSDEKQHEIAYYPDYRRLANRDDLIGVFGNYTGMNRSWFKNLKDTPDLKAARQVKGQGGRGHITEPWFCPAQVMLWLINPKRRKGRPLSDIKGWELLEKHFSTAYDFVSHKDPRVHD